MATIMGEGDGNGTAVTFAVAAAVAAVLAVPRLKTGGLVVGACLWLAGGKDLLGPAGLYRTTEAPSNAGLGARPVCSALPQPMGGDGTRTVAEGDSGGDGGRGRSEPFRYD